MNKEICCANCGKTLTLSRNLVNDWKTENGICCTAKCRQDLAQKIDTIAAPKQQKTCTPTARPEHVRLATPKDAEALYQILLLAHKENGYADFSECKVREFIESATRGGGSIAAIIEGDNGVIAGCFCARMAQWWYGDKWHLEELCNFVHPSYRQSNYGSLLIEFAKWFSEKMTRELNEPFPLFMGVLTNDRTAAKVRLYSRQLTNRGALFVHNFVL